MKKREQTGKGEEEEGSSSPLCVWSVENHISTIATTIINGSSNDSSRTPPLLLFRKRNDRRTNETNRDQGRTGKTDGRPNRNGPLHDDDDDDDDAGKTIIKIPTTTPSPATPHTTFFGVTHPSFARAALVQGYERGETTTKNYPTLCIQQRRTATTTHKSTPNPVQSSPVSRRFHVFDYFPGGGRFRFRRFRFFQRSEEWLVFSGRGGARRARRKVGGSGGQGIEHSLWLFFWLLGGVVGE